MYDLLKNDYPPYSSHQTSGEVKKILKRSKKSRWIKVQKSSNPVVKNLI